MVTGPEAHRDRAALVQVATANTSKYYYDRGLTIFKISISCVHTQLNWPSSNAVECSRPRALVHESTSLLQQIFDPFIWLPCISRNSMAFTRDPMLSAWSRYSGHDHSHHSFLYKHDDIQLFHGIPNDPLLPRRQGTMLTNLVTLNQRSYKFLFLSISALATSCAGTPQLNSVCFLWAFQSPHTVIFSSIL